MRAAALANDIKPPLALDRERLAALALAPRVKLSAMRANLNLAGYHRLCFQVRRLLFRQSLPAL